MDYSLDASLIDSKRFWVLDIVYRKFVKLIFFLFIFGFCDKVLVCELEVGNTNAEAIRRFSRFCAANCIRKY